MRQERTPSLFTGDIKRKCRNMSTTRPPLWPTRRNGFLPLRRVGMFPNRDHGAEPMGGVVSLSDLRVKLFADGADKSGMLKHYANPLIKGFTTNPSLMRKAGVTNYKAFAREIIELIPDR